MVTQFQVRQWAWKHGIPVNEQGAIPIALLERYAREHPDEHVKIPRRFVFKYDRVKEAAQRGSAEAARLRRLRHEQRGGRP